MKYIQKTKNSLKIKPNLDDYDYAYRTFSWKEAERELEWFDPERIHLNAAYNAVDRHLNSWRKNKIALYWEDENGNREEYTFYQIAELSNRFANILKDMGIKKGDRIFIFLPRVPELYYCFLGILKTGAVTGTMFQAFGPEGLLDRLENSGARFLITNLELSERLKVILRQLPKLEKVILIDDEKFRKKMSIASSEFKIAKTKADDNAFMLYTSGTTGKPKGVVHTHRAILQEHMTAKWVLDIQDQDVYWCTADPGWVTGIAYTILGSWSAGATSLIYNGRFDPERWYSLIEKYKVNIWYTAPTAIRMLIKSGKKLLKKYNFSSLRHLASVGEPLNPEAIVWGVKAFGLPFHDNWWQTETGGICIANYPSMDIKPGSMGKPIPGIEAAIVDDSGNELPPIKEGNLSLRSGWPSMMKTIWKRPEKYLSYFLNQNAKCTVPANCKQWRCRRENQNDKSKCKKNTWYISGDRAFRDRDGYFWFVGRADDVIKTAGERVGPFEVESALIQSGKVVEAGVIGKPDPERGEIIKAFCVLAAGIKPSEKLKEELSFYVKKHLAGHAYPREIEFVQSLPKTRSGKIMRRVLKAQELGLPIGDTSTMEEY